MAIRRTKERFPELMSEGLLDSRVKTRGRTADGGALALAEPRDVEYALRRIGEAVRIHT